MPSEELFEHLVSLLGLSHGVVHHGRVDARTVKVRRKPSRLLKSVQRILRLSHPQEHRAEIVDRISIIGPKTNSGFELLAGARMTPSQVRPPPRVPRPRHQHHRPLSLGSNQSPVSRIVVYDPCTMTFNQTGRKNDHPVGPKVT